MTTSRSGIPLDSEHLPEELTAPADVFACAPRQADPLPENPESLLAMVNKTMDTLLRRGIPAEDLAPLSQLRDAIGKLRAATHSPIEIQSSNDRQPSNRKESRSSENMAASDLLARTGAVIELLIQGGYTAEAAAQIVARQLLGAGIHMPEGGDARGWKRLLHWHTRLVHVRRRGPDYEEYLRFKARLNEIPAEQRIEAVLSGHLWDRRKLDEIVKHQA